MKRVSGNIRDLREPFQKGLYYLPAMGGSFSIKSVLPALFPNDKELDYHGLDGLVQNGGQAMEIFPRIQGMGAEEALLACCGLDTLALAKVWEKLKQACGMA